MLLQLRCFVDLINGLLSCYCNTITVHFKVYIVPNKRYLLFISMGYSVIVVIDSFNVIMTTVSILYVTLVIDLMIKLSRLGTMSYPHSEIYGHFLVSQLLQFCTKLPLKYRHT